MKIVLRNWGGVPAQDTSITLDVTATLTGKPKRTLSWTGRINGPVYPGQEFSLLPDLDFRELVTAGYRFRMTANVSCSSTVPVAFRNLGLARVLSHSQKQVWEWRENSWKLVGTDLNNLQAAAE